MSQPKVKHKKFVQDDDDEIPMIINPVGNGRNPNILPPNQDDSNSQLLDSPDDSSSNSEGNAEEDYETLDDLIYKLNDEDHSQDQGIQDYKIGGYHPCHIGEVLINRYVLIQKLGWGHFSTVWLAKDFKFGNYVAVKIMKSSPHYLQASYDEVQILQKVAKNTFHPEWMKSLKEYQPNKKVYDKDDCHVLNLLNSFLYKGPYGNHFCMVFQILGVNLLQVLKRYDYKGLPLHLVKQITRQVLMGLDFLNRICHVIHTDLKPENVLLCLTDQQIKRIVEDGQLSSIETFQDRLRLYRKKYGMGPESDDEGQTKPQKPNKKQAKQIDEDTKKRINELKDKLDNDHGATKNQKKNWRRKLNKILKDNDMQSMINESMDETMKKEVQNKKEQKKARTAKQLFAAFDTKIAFNKGPKLSQGFKVKIADLGNACWEHHHFATEIQTRQYRGPQVIIGSKYNISADMWSLACMTFQMLTGDLLFNPRNDNQGAFGKNDDHIAQMMQLMGRFPKKMSKRGFKAKKYFSKEGALNRIPRLQNWSIKDVMIAKYRFQESEAQFFMNFMQPMLNCYPQRRKLSHQMLKHPWLTKPNVQKYLMDSLTHDRIRAQRYDLESQKQEVFQYESQKEDASGEDNNNLVENDSDDQFYGYKKVGDIRYIDRSFMNLGYIGYQDGIYLQKLDTGPNWQFV